MEITNTQKLDALLNRHGSYILKTLQKECVDISDGAYYLTGLTHDTMRMLYSIMSRNMTSQEAKAAFKVAIDTVLLDYGLSVAIHEFN